MSASSIAHPLSNIPCHPHPLPLLEDQFVDMAFITRLTGLTDKWFYKLIQEGLFPKPIKFGRSSRWLKSEIEAWIQERIQASRMD